jgi:multicomponent Na+:H+ antiporter subunit E
LVLHAISLTIVLTIVWWLLSGYVIPLIMALGAGSVLATVWIAHRMDAADHESHPVHLAVRGVTYFPWLLWEIVKANYDVTKAILLGGDAIRPRLMVLKATQVSEVGRVTFANSITLTPGTVTIGVEDDVFTVHSLTPGSYEGLETGDMDRRVSEMELGKGGPSAEAQPALQDHPEDEQSVEPEA